MGLRLWITSPRCSSSVSPLVSVRQEYKRKQIEEQRQAERLQRQLQQERAYLVSLQQQQQEPPRPPQDKKQLYHYKDQAPSNNDKPTWAKEVNLHVPRLTDLPAGFLTTVRSHTDAQASITTAILVSYIEKKGLAASSFRFFLANSEGKLYVKTFSLYEH